MVVPAVDDCLTNGPDRPMVVPEHRGEDYVQNGNRHEDPWDQCRTYRILCPTREEQGTGQCEPQKEASIVPQVDSSPGPVVAEKAAARAHQGARQGHEIGLVA